MANTNLDNDWNINTDIYDIVDSVNKLKQRHIEDENETTLALGPFGFITDVESKKIQTSTIMVGQLGNEMFPTRAKLTKNVLTHAIFNGISGINATPAHITVTLGINVNDFEKYKVDNKFYMSAMSPIFIDKYEFHLDYDIMVKRNKVSNGYSYSAQYIIEDSNGDPINNPLSNINNVYLKQPFEFVLGDYTYIAIQAVVRQVTIEETEDTMTSDSIIENKTYRFEFSNQLANFNVKVVDNGKETTLIPYMFGADTEADTKYVWYSYINDHTIRLSFDSKSYIPGLNSKIYIKAYTTLGAGGNFEYLNISSNASDGYYVDIESEEYGYNKINMYLVGNTDSVDGANRKSKAELQKLIPKAAIARGNITMEKDVNNYFNLLDSPDNRLVMQKKVDNQLQRLWYGYFLLKDPEGNVIPTNTIPLRMNLGDNTLVECDDGRWILPAGSIIKYDSAEGWGYPIDEVDIPQPYTDGYFGRYYYYMTVYNILLCKDPLYCAFYLTTCDYDSYFTYEFVNEYAPLQFIANRFHFSRNLLVDQGEYNLTFNIAQSIRDSNYHLYEAEEIEVHDKNDVVSKETVVTQNLRVVIVFYKDGRPYRWKEATITDANNDIGLYSFSVTIYTDNQMDERNNLKLVNLYEAGTEKLSYGYFGPNVTADIFILAKLSANDKDKTVDIPDNDINSIAPGYEDYTVTNVYRTAEGLDIFKNLSTIISSKVTVDDNTDTLYYASSMPCVGYHYVAYDNESDKQKEHVRYLVEAINERKDYIDYCLQLLENSMSIDFKFFNTYGPSKTYMLEDNLDHSIGSIDITMNFRVSLTDVTDVYTINDLKLAIKDYIEDLYETGDLHIPNLITKLTNDFKNRIVFVEFVGFNNFDANYQHVYKVEPENPTTVPEFINIRNKIDPETLELIPCINIETV